MVPLIVAYFAKPNKNKKQCFHSLAEQTMEENFLPVRNLIVTVGNLFTIV